jgi:hypothetical protein
MAIVRSNAFPGTVFNPHLARQTSSSPSRTMRGIVVAPRLRQYPNGQPLDTVPRLQFSQTQNAVPQVAGSGRRRSLQGFTAAPGLQRFPNGQPLSPNPGGPVLVHKASLVNASLKRVMRKRCGLGDSTDTTVFQDPTYAESNPAGTVPAGLDNPDNPAAWLDTNPSAGAVIPGYNAATGVYTSSGGAVAAGAGPMDTIAGGYQTPTTTPTSFLTSLLNSLTGRTSAPGYGASGLVSNFGAGLNTPIVAGSSITNGGVLVMGGIFVFLFMAMTGKKR